MSAVFIGPTPRCLLGVTTRLHNPISRFVMISSEITEFVKMHVVNLTEEGLRQVCKRLYGAKIAIMGLAGGPRWAESVRGWKRDCVSGDWEKN